MVVSLSGNLGIKLLASVFAFCFELLDNYIGQFCCMFFPHVRQDEFLVQGEWVMAYTKFFVRAMQYLEGLTWRCEQDTGQMLVIGHDGAAYAIESFPLPLHGHVTPAMHGQKVFPKTCGWRTYSDAAFAYLCECFKPELENRVSKGRRETFRHRLTALAALYDHIEGDPERRCAKLSGWNRVHRTTLQTRSWSPGQMEALTTIQRGLDVCDENAMRASNRHVYLNGKPGSGKSEVLVHAAVAAASAGYFVLILCPTGTLFHSYRDRLPESDRIVVETIHSAFAVRRQHDQAVTYAPPTRLRKYDLILLDEASQVEDHVTQLLFMAIQELPQKPFVCVAADFQQLNPIQGGRLMQRLCADFQAIEMNTVFRTKDEDLLKFLSLVRCSQPTRADLASFFSGRHLSCSLVDAVRMGLSLSRSSGQIFSWLCVTNKGADEVNLAALSLLGIADDELAAGFPGDPKVHASRICPRVGLHIRLTRNLDKDRGFVNGAIGIIHHVLSPTIFILKLTTGNMVLVHPISSGDGHFLPCAYGYATTIRRAQGSSLDMGCLYFDHSYPPERGYGYVGASRFRSLDGLNHFGKLRRTDWLPVNGDPSTEHTRRSEDSEDGGYDDQDAELEALHAVQASQESDGGGLMDDLDVHSETKSTGYDDEFDEELEFSYAVDATAEENLDPDGSERDLDGCSNDNEQAEYYPGDDGYDADFVVDHEALADHPSADLDGLSLFQ